MATERLSKEKIEIIRKYCMTHPKADAVKLFRLTYSTIARHTKGINWKNNNKDDGFDEDPDTMEMPCMCDCGRWFDLHSGRRNKYGDKTICVHCYHNQKDEDDERD